MCACTCAANQVIPFVAKNEGNPWAYGIIEYLVVEDSINCDGFLPHRRLTFVSKKGFVILRKFLCNTGNYVHVIYMGNLVPINDYP